MFCSGPASAKARSITTSTPRSVAVAIIEDYSRRTGQQFRRASATPPPAGGSSPRLSPPQPCSGPTRPPGSATAARPWDRSAVSRPSSTDSGPRVHRQPHHGVPNVGTRTDIDAGEMAKATWAGRAGVPSAVIGTQRRSVCAARAGLAHMLRDPCRATGCSTTTTSRLPLRTCRPSSRPDRPVARDGRGMRATSSSLRRSWPIGALSIMPTGIPFADRASGEMAGSPVAFCSGVKATQSISRSVA